MSTSLYWEATEHATAFVIRFEARGHSKEGILFLFAFVIFNAMWQFTVLDLVLWVSPLSTLILMMLWDFLFLSRQAFYFLSFSGMGSLFLFFSFF